MSTATDTSAPAVAEAASESGTGTLFRLATAGSVDDGKSTLVGRLLYDAQAILSDQLASISREEFEEDEGLDLALLTDGLRAEREQGITIDVAYRYFATDRRSFVLADCPGHVQYTRNTVTGASTADAVVLLVDVRHGVVEQTRRHLAVAALLRVEHVIIAVNKIDAVDYSEAAFEEVERDILNVAEELSAGELKPIVIPVSALRGDNVVTVSANTPWYTAPRHHGQALLPVLENLPDADESRRAEEPLRLPVQTVIRPHQDYRGYAGQIASGSLTPGDTVRIQPGTHTATVTAVERTELQQQLADAGADVDAQSARAGESVTVRLDADYDVARGSILTDTTQPAVELSELQLKVAWLAEGALTTGAKVLVKQGTATVKGLVTAVNDRLDLSTLTAQPAEELLLNDIGTVEVKLASALPVDDYFTSKRTGAALLIDPTDGNTLAAGMIQLPQVEAEADAQTGEDWLAS